MSSNGEDSVDGTLEKKEEALVEAVREVKIKDDVKEDGGKKNEEGTGKKAAEPDKALLKSQFVLFSKFGDKSSDGETIKLSQSDKWFKQAGVISANGVSTTDTGIAFRKISKRSPKLSFTEWTKYVDEITTSKKLDANEIKGKLAECGAPGTTGATKVVKSTAVDRLTDTSKYGGAHKQRFNSDGTGRGKEGRVDPKSDGYVAGYKNKKSADAKMRPSS